MKKIIPFIFVSISLIGTAQEVNPFESIGKEGKMLTLSKGKYKEFHDNDSLQQIGSVIVNTNTGTIYELLDVDTLYSESTLDPTIISRWYSPDPLAHEFPYLNPYNFVANSPLMFVDPDGRKLRPVNDTSEKLIKAKYEKYQAVLIDPTVDHGNDVVSADLTYSTSATYANKSDFKAALKKSNSNTTKEDIEEGWIFYNGLKDPKVIEFQIVNTETGGEATTRGEIGGTAGSEHSRFDAKTSNYNLKLLFWVMANASNGVLTQPIADALYNQKPITVTDQTTNDTRAYTINPDKKGTGWVFFKDDETVNTNVKGQIIIDGTGKTDEQKIKTVIESIKTVEGVQN